MGVTFETIMLVIMAVSAASWTGRARRARAGDLPYRWGIDARSYLAMVRFEAPSSAAFCALWALWHVVGLMWAALDGDKPALHAAIENWSHALAAAWTILTVLWIALRRRFDAETGRQV